MKNDVIYKVVTIPKMMCQNCIKHIDKALSKINYVTAVTFDLTLKKVTITSTTDISNEVIIKTLAETGYVASFEN